MTVRDLLRMGLAAVVAGLLPAAALAVEGGSVAYLLGSRDTFAGIAPPPGTYFSLDVLHLDGQVPYLAIGGIVVTQATTKATVQSSTSPSPSQSRSGAGSPSSR